MKLAIGFITYTEATAIYLPYFLKYLNAQTNNDTVYLAIDNSTDHENSNIKILREHPEIVLEVAEENLGFAKAYNRMIKKAINLGAEYFLVVNPDVALEKNTVSKLVDALEGDSKLGSVSPKIYKWDFSKAAEPVNPEHINSISGQTNIIDSCGIALKPGLRFYDLGQGEVDRGQYDQGNAFGPSGAAAIFRLSALEAVKENGQYFDERMFMYKEDCDLAYRLNKAGFAYKLVNNAIAYHDRTAYGQGSGDLKAALNRKNKSRQVKEWSFINQHIIFLKHWNTLNALNKFSVLWQVLKMFVYIFLFERYLFKCYFKLKEIWI